MNIFKEKSDIFGQCSSKKVYELMKNFLKITRKIKRALGENSYKLDKYLDMLLQAINFELNTNAANDGVNAYCELRGICSSILSFNTEYQNHGFYHTAKEFIKNNKFKYKEDHTLLEIYIALLTPKFTSFALKRYIEKIRRKSNSVLDIVELNQSYEYLSNTVGKTEIDSLNAVIMEIFLLCPVINSFLQSISNHYLFCLLHRDEETSKQIFQLITDS